MKRLGTWLIAGVTLAAWFSAASLPLARGAEPDAATQAKFAERLRLWQIADGFNQERKWAEAAKAGKQMLAVERELFGDSHEYVMTTMGWVAGCYEVAYDFEAAVNLRRGALSVAQQLYPAEDWRVTDARISLAEVEAGVKLTAQQRRSLQGADELYARGLEHYENGRYPQALSLGKQAAAVRKTILGERHRAHLSALVLIAAALNEGENKSEARPVLQQILDLRLKLLGEDHPDTAIALTDLAVNYASVEAYDKALPLERRALEVVRKCQGEQSEEFAAAAITLGTIHKELRQFDEAGALFLQAFEIRKQALGEEHVDTVSAMGYLAALYKSTANYRAAEPLLREAVDLHLKLLGAEHAQTTDSMNSLGMVCEALGKYAEAESLFHQVLEVRKKTLGLTNPDTAISLNNLAYVYQTMGRPSAAEPLLLEALEANQKTLGEERPETAISLNNLSRLYAEMRENAKAKEFGLKSLELRKRISGENSPDTARSLNNMAHLYHTLGDYSQAEAHFQQALAVFSGTLGEETAETATTLSNLSTLYMAMGDYSKAEAIQLRVLEIRKKLHGEDHPEIAMCWSNLAGTYNSPGEAKKAEVYHRKALVLFEKTLGPDHPHTVTALCNVSADYLDQKDYETAQSFLIRAWESQKRTLGEEHPDTLATSGHLGHVYRLKGDFEQAEPLLQQAVASHRRTFGDKHPQTRTQLIRLAAVYQGLGQYATAERHGHEAVSILLEHLENTFGAQSERQKLLMLAELRDSLDMWLTVAHDAHHPADDLYGKLLAWKGVVFASEAGLRALRKNPDTAALFTEYREVSRRLSSVALALPRNFDERAKRDTQLQELTDRKEAIEQKLARLDAGFRQRRQQGHLAPRELQELLPSDVALVDFFEYTSTHPKEDKAGVDKHRRLIAFVVRKGQPLAEVELGPTATIEADIERWRGCFGSWTGEASEDPGQSLRRTLWEPIAAHCGDAKTVLVSPDGAVSQLPFAALPGAAPESFLLQEYAFATIPVPQLLPQMLAAAAGHSVAADVASLLLVGGVDYGGSPGKADENAVSRSIDPATRSASLAGFQQLPGTLSEIESIDERFRRRYDAGRSQMLDRARATEAEFRELAPEFRWLHLSTHGFFAPDKLKNALDRSSAPSDAGGGFSRLGVAAYHPGLLSGLAMAGANSKSQPGEDDGILTALEVASLDLSKVDVAVLSACETGLGRMAGGEGVLGLQRAFQVSGAKTIVASLWAVPDQATMRLMQRFYANLWDGNMSKLEALREAQLWLLTDPANQTLLTAEERATAGNSKYLPPLRLGGVCAERRLAVK